MYSDLRRAQLLARLFSNASVYGLGTLLTRACGILLLPVYWIKLTPAEFGLIGLCQALLVFLGPILSLGLNDAMQRFYYDWSPAQRPQHLGALWLSTCAFGLMCCLLLDFFGRHVFALLFTQVSFDPFLRITLWSAFAINISLIPLTVLRVREEICSFTLVTVAAFAIQASLALWFLFRMELGVTGYLLAALISNGLVAVYAALRMLREVRLTLNWSGLRDPLRYALPLVPASVMEGLSTTLDRIVLDKFVGLTQIGLYNIGNQFGSALNMFNQILKSAWVPFVFRAASERTDGPAVLGKFSVYYIAALCVPALAIALLSRDFVMVAGDARYHGVYSFVPAFVLLYLVQGSGTALGRGIDIAKKTGWALVVPAVSVIVGATTLYVLVPTFGVWGAVAAALITAVVRTGTHVFLAVRFYPRPLHLGALMRLVAITFCAFLVGHFLARDNLAADVAMKLIIIVLATLAMLWFALDRRQALALLRDWRQSR